MPLKRGGGSGSEERGKEVGRSPTDWPRDEPTFLCEALPRTSKGNGWRFVRAIESSQSARQLPINQAELPSYLLVLANIIGHRLSAKLSARKQGKSHLLFAKLHRATGIYIATLRKKKMKHQGWDWLPLTKAKYCSANGKWSGCLDTSLQPSNSLMVAWICEGYE